MFHLSIVVFQFLISHMLHLCLFFDSALYKLLQQPMAICDRSSLDNMLLTCLRLLSGIVYVYSEDKYLPVRSTLGGALLRTEVTQRYYKHDIFMVFISVLQLP